MSPTPKAKIQAVVEPPVAPIQADSNTPTAKRREPLTEKEWENMDKPKVLIVGAGIGGLFLGNLLHKANIPFEIYERAREVKPLAILHSNQHKRRAIIFISSGAEEYLIARPDLYDLLLNQIPQENIHMGKKILSFEQNDLGVMIRCNDNKTHHGDILVGADGAYSAIRQHLFKVLKGKKLLPPSDEGDLPYNCVCLVGQTEILDPEDFPYMKLPHSKLDSVLGTEFR
ncbi:hypothetical protein BGZ82_009045, partial [Podila clonocystis]